MNIIPLRDAIALLKQCSAVTPSDGPIVAPEVNARPNARVFLVLSWCDDESFRFQETYHMKNNANVLVYGSTMRLLDIGGNECNLKLHQPMKLAGEFPMVIKRWLKDGDPGMSEYVGHTTTLLEVAGRRLDKAYSGEVVGDILFEGENGKMYTGSVEFTMHEETDASVVAEAEADLASGDYALGDEDDEDDDYSQDEQDRECEPEEGGEK